MFRKAVVGVDEQQGGRDATALAKHLLEPGGSLIRSRVLIREPLMGHGASPEFERSERERVQKRDADTSPTAGDLRCIYAPSVGRGLHELVDGADADLLVVGSSRRGLLGRMMLGDDTSDALNGVPCAVAIAPLGYADHPRTRGEIGVAYNGSAESQDALAIARSLAGEFGAKLSAFEAISVPAYVSAPGAGAAGEMLPLLVEEARERIAALGQVEAHAVYGMAAEELALYSASLDLLVVGSRGYGPLGRLVHGSVSRQIARSARCPVLVLTRGARVVIGSESGRAGRPAVPALA